MVFSSLWSIAALSSPSTLFVDGPEYEQRKGTEYRPTQTTLSQLHSAVPPELRQKSTLRSLTYVVRDVFFAYAAYRLAWLINPTTARIAASTSLPWLGTLLKGFLWLTYWHFQGIILAGWWCTAHEAGHGSLSDYSVVNTTVGYLMHSFLLVPYFAWRSSHHAHHKATSSLDRDENFVPKTRTAYGLPPKLVAQKIDYHELFEEAPLYTLLRMLFMQALGWQYYLLTNIMGNEKLYPEGANHFFPTSPLFKPNQRWQIIMSNIGLTAMSCILYTWATKPQVGWGLFLALYGIPYLLSNHWIVMLTYLHHSDPTIPHFRGEEWSFLRGAIATVDRPLLGWAGRFFLKNVSHDHVAHHLFSSIPFYNQPKVTERLKEVLKDDYNYDSTNTIRALHRTFTECCFIEDEGGIVFYKNKNGEAARTLAPDVAKSVGGEYEENLVAGKEKTT